MYCFEGTCIYNSSYMNASLYLHVNKPPPPSPDNAKYLHIGNDISAVFACNL